MATLLVFICAVGIAIAYIYFDSNSDCRANAFEKLPIYPQSTLMQTEIFTDSISIGQINHTYSTESTVDEVWNFFNEQSTCLAMGQEEQGNTCWGGQAPKFYYEVTINNSDSNAGYDLYFSWQCGLD
jgi:hypothetical protein